MKIHFTSLLCVDFDYDLVPHWINHYSNRGFTDYHIFLHSPSNNEDLTKQVKALFDLNGWGVTVVDGSIPFAVGNLRRDMIWPYVKSFPDTHYAVIADSDEFQMVDDYVRRLRTYPTIRGILIDRWSYTLHDCVPGIPLNDQYPMIGRLHRHITTNPHFPEGLRREFPDVVRDKICAMPCGAPGDYNGSHSLFPTLPGNNVPVAVEHYSWRSTAIARMCGKPYFTPASIWYVMKWFGMNPHLDAPKEFWARVEEWEKLQVLKGWIPASWTDSDYRNASQNGAKVSEFNTSHMGINDV